MNASRMRLCGYREMKNVEHHQNHRDRKICRSGAFDDLRQSFPPPPFAREVARRLSVSSSMIASISSSLSYFSGIYGATAIEMFNICKYVSLRARSAWERMRRGCDRMDIAKWRTLNTITEIAAIGRYVVRGPSKISASRRPRRVVRAKSLAILVFDRRRLQASRVPFHISVDLRCDGNRNA